MTSGAYVQKFNYFSEFPDNDGLLLPRAVSFSGVKICIRNENCVIKDNDRNRRPNKFLHLWRLPMIQSPVGQREIPTFCLASQTKLLQ